MLRLALGIPEIDLDVKNILPWEPSVQIAEQLQHGRIFLAGDTAHQMPPWAGQGANSGITDVHNLSWKLAAVMKGGMRQALLQTYDVERIRVGRAAAEVSASAANETGIIATRLSFNVAIGLLERIRLISGHGYCDENEGISSKDNSPPED